MVRYTESAGLIPEWVHQFRQWHVDMFEALPEAYQEEVYQQGGWIVYPAAPFTRLDPSFSIPSEPIIARVPPDNLARFANACSSLREPPPAIYRDESPELSGPERRSKRLKTRGKSFFYTRLFFLYSFSFLDFDEMPNEGIGRVAPHGNQKQARQALLTARQNRRRQSSPESRTQPLPKLISIKDLDALRHDIPPVSHVRLLSFPS
jgi:hypothetical protein